MIFLYYQPLCDVLAFPQFFYDKMTSLDFFDMYLVIFYITSQYLVNIYQYLVKLREDPPGWRPQGQAFALI